MAKFFPSITFKLFLSILLSCIAITLAMGVAVRYSFETGFDDYVQEREQQRISDLADILATEYQDLGSWDKQSRKYWNRLLRFSAHNVEERRLPPLRVSLVAENGDLIAGFRINPADKPHKTPVEVEGQLVGWLLSTAHLPKALNDELDRQFQQRQLHATWSIVALSVLLAVLVSLLLARILVVPVKRLARATNSLANGDYAVRVQVKTNDELGELAKNFNKLAFSLERNKSLRHDLMADISHELRTPISVLRSEIEAMQDGLKAVDGAALQSLLYEIQQLSKLIDDLYELSLADAGALTYTKVELDLSNLLDMQLSLNETRFNRAGIQLKKNIKNTIHINGDEKRLVQLINNLLENSLRYTDAPGILKVGLQLVNQTAIIELEDTEPGVSSEQATGLFDRFYRLESSRNKAYGGAGLGLAICQQIVQAHQGEIKAMPSDLGGLKISISLPVRKHGTSI